MWNTLTQGQVNAKVNDSHETCTQGQKGMSSDIFIFRGEQLFGDFKFLLQVSRQVSHN